MRLPRLAAALAAIALLLPGAPASAQDAARDTAQDTGQVTAQDTARDAARDPVAGSPIAPLMHGALVFHGNYCGPGHKGGHPAPIDALDEACMRHDACVKDFEVPSCGCNADLAREAAAVASDPGASADLREAADFTARGAKALPCR